LRRNRWKEDNEVAEAGAADPALRAGAISDTTRAEHADRESADIHAFCVVGEYSTISPGSMSRDENRLETIKMIYHDPNIEPDSIKDGHIVRYGDLVFDDSQRNKLTELENTLMNQHTLEIPDSDKKYSLVLDFLTRNEESLTRARDTAFADQFNIPKQGSVKDRVTQANEKRDQKLKGFKGLFGLS
jgi:hypothetical protein